MGKCKSWWKFNRLQGEDENESKLNGINRGRVGKTCYYAGIVSNIYWAPLFQNYPGCFICVIQLNLTPSEVWWLWCSYDEWGNAGSERHTFPSRTHWCQMTELSFLIFKFMLFLHHAAFKINSSIWAECGRFVQGTNRR